MNKLKSDRLSHLANNPELFPTERQKQIKRDFDKKFKKQQSQKTKQY